MGEKRPEHTARLDDGPQTPQATEPIGRVGLNSARVLVVARAPAEGDLRALIEAAGISVRGVRNSADAPEVARVWKPHVILIDAEITEPAPAELVARTRKHHNCGVVLLVPAFSGETVTLAEQCGADTIMVQPLDLVILRRYLVRELDRSPVVRPAKVEALRLPPQLVGSCSPMREVWRLVLLAAQSDSSVILAGETGTGKEVLARALHRFSARRSGPFIAVNCAAIPETLLESELFGHERGAFTGAAGQRKGRFELAHGGTLFLDEIGDLPLLLQVKLLRALQERSFERVGGTETVSVDVRVIAATHKNVEEEVLRGRFRADLYYRLNVLSIRVPPLRERRSDILGLWQNLIVEGATREGRRPPSTSMAVQRLLLQHNWPGNIRELHNIAQHVLTVATGDQILPADLPGHLAPQTERPREVGSLVGLTLKEVERAAILETYDALGTVTGAASVLDISPRKIHYRLSEYKREGYLPSKERAQAVPTQVDPAPADGPRAPRVLLAEDDDDLRWALSDLLKSEGYDVVAVPDGRVFLEQLGSAVLLGQAALPADVIVTDVRMPGLTGMQILERIRERGWSIPVVVISAYADREVRAQAERLGASFLHKPLDFGALQRIIAESVLH
jgi:two-component system response regulator HydG